jgi:hypothetical protein
VPSKNVKTVLAASALLGLGGAATVLSISPATAAPVSASFEFTGAPEDFVVPEGVCSVTVDAFGAEGGVGSDGNTAGLGGHTTATIEVTPGETLVVTVGGQGADGGSQVASEGQPLGSGGFNGGGNGGNSNNQDPGGGGGGASDVRQGGADLTDRVVIAGGGGGSGGDSAELDAPDADEVHPPGSEGLVPSDRGSGGAGGGATGTAGQDSGFGSGGGGGGTQTAGGAAGVPDPDATAGSLGQGGKGGTGSGGKGFNDGGGGGGGGLYGGGGGSGDTFVPGPPAAPTEGGSFTSDGGGGGGGSGFGPAGTTFETGVQAGDGAVTITYDLDGGDACEPSVLPTSTVPGTEPPVVAGQPAFTG